MNDATQWNSGKTADKLDAQFHILTLKTFLFLRRFWSRCGFTVLILRQTVIVIVKKGNEFDLF